MRPPPVVEERTVAPAVDATAVLLRLEDAVASLRTWLVVVGVIAVAGALIATYALLEDDDRGTSNARAGLASDARVSELEDRIDRLSRQVQDARSAARSNDTDELGDRVRALERAVADREPATDATQAIEELSSRVDTLQRDVEQLKQAAAAP